MATVGASTLGVYLNCGQFGIGSIALFAHNDLTTASTKRQALDKWHFKLPIPGRRPSTCVDRNTSATKAYCHPMIYRTSDGFWPATHDVTWVR